MIAPGETKMVINEFMKFLESNLMSNFPKEYNFACTLTFSDFTPFAHISLFEKSRINFKK